MSLFDDDVNNLDKIQITTETLKLELRGFPVWSSLFDDDVILCCCSMMMLMRFPYLYDQDVVLVKDGGPMGLSIIGGSDHFCVPFGSSADDPGIYVSKVRARISYYRMYNLPRKLLFTE